MKLTLCVLSSLLSFSFSIHHTKRTPSFRASNFPLSVCDRSQNLLLLEMTINDEPTNDDDEFDPCAEAKKELKLVYDTREDATNTTMIDDRLDKLTEDESKEQKTEAIDMEKNQKIMVTSKLEYNGEASILHAEMQVVGSCSEAAHLALFHAFESRQRGDPVSSQSALINLATDRVECAEKKLIDILPLREKIIKLRSIYNADKKNVDASEKRVRSLIKHQFSFAKKACDDLKAQASKAHVKLLSILSTTKSDAKIAASKFETTNVMDDNLMMAIQKGNVAAAQGKVFHEAIVARQKTTCAREERLKSELGDTTDEHAAKESDPYENVNHGEATHYPEVDRLRNELNGVLAAYSQARMNANLAEANFKKENSESSADAASGPAGEPNGGSGPAAVVKKL